MENFRLGDAYYKAAFRERMGAKRALAYVNRDFNFRRRGTVLNGHTSNLGWDQVE